MPRRLWLPIITLASLLVFSSAWVARDIAFAGATACEEGFKLKNGKCKPVKKAQGCPAGTVPVPETDNCVPKAKPAAEFEKEPWKKPGCAKWQKQCDQGNGPACAKYESTCQVN
jgi:hypothetical protein